MAVSKAKKSPFHFQVENERLRQSVEELTVAVQTLTSVLAPELERTATLQRMEAESLSARIAVNDAVKEIYRKPCD